MRKKKKKDGNANLCARLCALEVSPALVDLLQAASKRGRRLIAAGRSERVRSVRSVLPGRVDDRRRH
jgi:hypothetical protein